MKKSLNKNKKINILTKRNIIILIVLVLLIPLTVYGYNKWLDYNDQQRFMKVKADVEEIQRRLEAAAPEVTWKLEPTCRRAHLTFGDGDASCEIRVSAQLNTQDGEFAYNTAKKLDSVVAGNENLELDKASDNDAFLKTLSDGYDGQSYSHKGTNMNCSTLKQVKSSGLSSEVYLSFNCRDYSRDTWLPRSDI